MKEVGSFSMAEKKKDEVDRYLIVTEPIADLRREPLDPARGRL